MQRGAEGMEKQGENIRQGQLSPHRKPGRARPTRLVRPVGRARPTLVVQ